MGEEKAWWMGEGRIIWMMGDEGLEAGLAMGRRWFQESCAIFSVCRIQCRVAIES